MSYWSLLLKMPRHNFEQSLAVRCRYPKRPASRCAHPERINLGGLALKKYEAIKGSLPADSKSRGKTTIGRDNELFWTEKFISDATAHSAARVAA